MSGALAIGTQSGNLLLLDIKGWDYLGSNSYEILSLRLHVWFFVSDIYNFCRRNSLDSLRNRFSEMVILDLKRMSENDIKDRITKLDGQSNHIAVLLSG